MNVEKLYTHDKIDLYTTALPIVAAAVFLAIIIDLCDGVYTAKVTGQRVHSHKLRVTINKTAEYLRYVFVGFLVDVLLGMFRFYEFPFLAVVAGALLLITEILSMVEHSRRRKSATKDLPIILGKIIEAATKHDAKEVLNDIIKKINDSSKDSRNG